MDRQAVREIAFVFILLLLFSSKSLGTTEPNRGVRAERPGGPAATAPSPAPLAQTPESQEIPPLVFSWVRLVFGVPGPKSSTGLTGSPPAGAFALTALERWKLDLAREACVNARAQAGPLDVERRTLLSEKNDAMNLRTAAETRADSAAMVGLSLPPRQDDGPPGLSDAEREKLRTANRPTRAAAGPDQAPPRGSDQSGVKPGAPSQKEVQP
jgi:hypothetical protein